MACPPPPVAGLHFLLPLVGAAGVVVGAPPLPPEVVVVPPEVGPQRGPPLGGAGVPPPLRLCYSLSPHWREEHVFKICRCIPVIKDVMVDRGESILVTPPATTAGGSQNVTKHFYLSLIVPTHI
jgi:hypothetical protein